MSQKNALRNQVNPSENMHEWKIVLAGNKDLQIKAKRRFGTLLKIHWTIAIKIYK